MNLRRLLDSILKRRRSDTGADDVTGIVFQAAEANDIATLAGVLEKYGVEALRQDRDSNQLTTLHLAAARGSKDAVEYLLSAAVRADPGAARDNNFTPLHGAAMHGHTEICEALLREGAGVNIQTDPQKYSPLHSAAFAGHVDTIKLLLAKGADRNLVNYRGEKAVDTARRQHQMAAVSVLEAENE